MKVIILAGGSGTRLWPLSRDRFPKQFVKFQGKKESLFQETFKRSLLVSNINDIYVVTNDKYRFLVSSEIEEMGFTYDTKNIIVEPEPKNTLPAIYAGVQEIVKYGHDSILVLPSDHIIKKSDEFSNIIVESEELTSQYLITFGIAPDSPNTGYGYISPGGSIKNGFLVESFKEKPTKNAALDYIAKGYFWNSGIFLFRSEVFVEEVKSYSKNIYDAFLNSKNINEAFEKIKVPLSIDYGVMELSKRVAVVPVNVGWNDLGSFDAFYDVFPMDTQNNISEDQNIIVDSKNNILQSYDEKIIAAVGIEDLIVIDNRDALLICKKDQSQKVKEVVDTLKLRKDSRFEFGVQDYRPWGYYKILEEEKGSFKIKRITVLPGHKLSYQLHHHRSEHWVVVKGMATVTLDEKEIFVRSGESIFFKEGQRHRLENKGKIPLEIIEVQMGQYLEEDDIVRFDDVYKRT